jgi:GNAT superfamily N-acetyltransferase
MSVKEIQIRKAVAEDIPWLSGCQLKMAEETEDLMLDLAEVTKGVAHVIANPATGAYYIACNRDTRVACLMILHEWSDWRNGEVWWIHSLYVEPAWRREGVFRKLYAYIKDLVMNDDRLRGIRLYVDKRNSSAVQAYKSLGMDDSHYTLFEWLK